MQVMPLLNQSKKNLLSNKNKLSQGLTYYEGCPLGQPFVIIH